MKASEFVKKFGWDFSKSCIENMVFSVGSFGGCVCVPKDLKRFVESHELIESCGGLDSVGEKLTHGMYESRAIIDRLKQAILDVESCM